jgi:hypothetical protein
MPKNPTVRTLLAFSAAIVLAAGLFKLVAGYDRYVADSQWYLLDPPRLGEGVGQLDQSAPLSEWYILESFASRGPCEAVVKAVREELKPDLAKIGPGRCVAATSTGVPHTDAWWSSHPEFLIDRNPPPATAVARLLNRVAADSRTHPGISLSDRLVELWVPLLPLAFFVYALIGALRPRVTRAISRIGGLFSNEFETREVNYIAWTMDYDELKAKGWDLLSEDGQKMVYAGTTAHLLDAFFEYDCRWDVRFTRWIRGLPPRKRFASAVATLRDIRKETQQRQHIAPEPTQEPPPSNGS